MKNFLYFFVNRDKTEFKIGITEDIEERYLRLTSLWGEIDLAASCMLAGSRREVDDGELPPRLCAMPHRIDAHRRAKVRIFQLTRSKAGR